MAVKPVTWWIETVLYEIATSIIGFYVGHWAERNRLYPRIILIIVICTIIELPIGHRDLDQQDKGQAEADARAAFHRALKLLTFVFFISFFFRFKFGLLFFFLFFKLALTNYTVLLIL